jgi:hypothetical protein
MLTAEKLEESVVGLDIFIYKKGIHWFGITVISSLPQSLKKNN